MRTALVVLATALGLAAASPAEAGNYLFPDAELMNTPEFRTEPWSLGTLDGRTDLPGPGVRFEITLGVSDDGKTAAGDDWPIAPTGGLAWDDGGGYAQPHDNVSLAAYDGIEMTVRYASCSAGADIQMKLFMNTGMTGPSGYPPGESANNTYWCGGCQTLSVGEVVTLSLDFDLAEAWSINDNPFPHTGGGQGWADGGQYAINDRDRREVTHYGFELWDAAGGAGLGQSIVLEASIPEPGSAVLLACGALAVVRRRSGRVLSGHART
jgi:hypothetical protein